MMRMPTKKTSKKKKSRPKITTRKKSSRPVIKKDKNKTTITSHSPKIERMVRSSSKLRHKSKWVTQKKKNKAGAKYYPRILFFGEKGTGKTHVISSAFEQEEISTIERTIPSFCPTRIIDCNRSAPLIASKDFPEDYSDERIIIVNPYIDDNGKVILDPIQRVESVWTLIKDCKEFTDGCLAIDGADQIVNDAMYYIYKFYNIYQRSDGTLWKREIKDGVEREKTINQIPPIMYGPRNKILREILFDISTLQIPVIFVAHSKEK